MNKRTLNLIEICNISFGFLGIQIGFALQNANASRILQTFGADIYQLSWFWLIAPLMGLLVQPLVGYYSDKTWTKLGRRRPFLLVGALFTAVGLILMPQSNLFITFLPPLWIGAGVLILIDASVNMSMTSFRALVGDNLGDHQKTLGFSVQSVLIGIGAVIGSWLPYVLANWFGLTSIARNGIPKSLIGSFIIGAVFLVLSILITVFFTKEYNPNELASFSNTNNKTEKKSHKTVGVKSIITDFKNMPNIMKQLSGVQFFSWFGLFSMWVFTTPAIAEHIFHTNDVHSKLYNDAGDWVGIIFGVYNLTSAIAAFFLPVISKKIGSKQTYATSLLIGGLGLISIFFATDKYFLIFSMIAVGIAWASILCIPYAMLASDVNPKKMGVYMGIFNFFIVIPQIINAIIGGPILKYFYDNQAIYALITAGISFIIAAVLALRIKEA